MKKINFKLLTVLLLSGLQAKAFAQTYVLTSTAKEGSVNFKAIGKPAFIKIEGHGEGPVGSVKIEGNKMSGEMNFALNTLNTGIDLRDEHMKDTYLKVKENPMATLKFESQELSEAFDPQKNNLSGKKITAKLTLNKITKDVVVDWESKNTGATLQINSKFNVKLSDYNIQIPEYAGIKVADEVKLEVNSTLNSGDIAALGR